MATVNVKHSDPLEKHRAMMKSPELWPCRPLLCVKRGNTLADLECGVLAEGAWTVTEWKFDLLSPWQALEDTRARQYTYESLDALMADGWIVD